MRSLLLHGFLAAGTFAVAGCSTARPLAQASEDCSRLAGWMTGSFSSAAQAASDPENFYDISLIMEPIWLDRTDGPWLYVEQAAADSLERPYRQRVYRLVQTDDFVRSEVFELPGDPLEYAGAHATPERFDRFGPADLSEREGCAITLARLGAGYTGSTADRTCGSTLGGASYATSEVTVTRDLLTSWDRGFDEEGQQVWGAELGPYRFVKLSVR